MSNHDPVADLSVAIKVRCRAESIAIPDCVVRAAVCRAVGGDVEPVRIDAARRWSSFVEPTVC
jgi:hypothetical protein